MSKLANYTRRMALAGSNASTEHRETCFYCYQGSASCFTAQMLTSKEYKGWIAWHKAKLIRIN